MRDVCRARARFVCVARGEEAQGARCTALWMRPLVLPCTVLHGGRLLAHVLFELRMLMCGTFAGDAASRSSGLAIMALRFSAVCATVPVSKCSSSNALGWWGWWGWW